MGAETKDRVRHAAGLCNQRLWDVLGGVVRHAVGLCDQRLWQVLWGIAGRQLDFAWEQLYIYLNKIFSE